MSESHKRKKSYYKHGRKKSRYHSDLSPKMKGFIVTTSGKERSATSEAFRLLNEFADKRYGPEKVFKGDASDEDDDETGVGMDGDDIEEVLKKQVTHIKAACKKDAKRRFQIAQGKAKNVIFIKTSLDDPTKLVTDIFEDLKTNGIQKTQHCQRLLPVIDTCHAKLDQILSTVRPIVKTTFHDSVDAFTYSIKWKSRCNNLKRDDVFAGIVKMIREEERGHTTDYDFPEVVLNIDIIGNVCCFGVLRNFNNYSRYNMEMVYKKRTGIDVDKKSGDDDGGNQSTKVPNSPGNSASINLESDNKPDDCNDNDIDNNSTNILSLPETSADVDCENENNPTQILKNDLTGDGDSSTRNVTLLPSNGASNGQSVDTVAKEKDSDIEISQQTCDKTEEGSTKVSDEKAQ